MSASAVAVVAASSSSSSLLVASAASAASKASLSSFSSFSSSSAAARRVAATTATTAAVVGGRRAGGGGGEGYPHFRYPILLHRRRPWSSSASSSSRSTSAAVAAAFGASFSSSFESRRSMSSGSGSGSGGGRPAYPPPGVGGPGRGRHGSGRGNSPGHRRPGGGGGGGRLGGGGRGRGAGAFDRFRDAMRRWEDDDDARRPPEEDRRFAGPPPSEGGAEAGGTRSKPAKKFHRGGPKKPNFAREVLDPAFRGELTKRHDSGIPKLVARKKKSRAVHDGFPGREAEEMVDDDESRVREEGGEEERTGGEEEEAGRARGGGGGRAATTRPTPRFAPSHRPPPPPPHAKPKPKPKPPRYLDREDDPVGHFYSDFDPSLYEDWRLPGKSVHAALRSLKGMEPDGDGGFVGTYNPLDNEDSDEEEEEERIEEEAKWRETRGKGKVPIADRYNADRTPFNLIREVRDPDTGEIIPKDIEEEYFYRDVLNFRVPFPDAPPEVANRLLPLADHGPDLDDFLEAMIEHPTKYAQVSRIQLHPDSRREAKPTVFPRDRRNPPKAFVRKHGGFVYVDRMERPVVNGALGEYDDPIARQMLSEAVAELFGTTTTTTTRVFPSTVSSAFVGFDSIESSRSGIARAIANRDEAAKKGDPVNISPFGADSEGGEGDLGDVDGYDEFATAPSDGKSVVRVDDLPPSTEDETVETIRRIFSEACDDEALEVLATTPTAALVKLPSNVASDVLDAVRRRAASIVRRTEPRFFPARRAVAHDRWAGVANRHQIFKLSATDLIVMGDVPTKEFYVSHYAVLHLRDVDPSVTKEELTALFRPYCADVRDEIGSIEFCLDAEGRRTGSVYVGFDRNGEAREAYHSLLGRHRSRLESTLSPKVQMTLVKDALLRRGRRTDPRPDRSVEELLSNLDDWERHVNPKDIELFEEHGIPRDVLAEALRPLRYRSRTMGFHDQSIVSERLFPEREVDTYYRDTVKLYVRTLKGCLVTKERPGLMYKGMFLEGEEVDTDYFDVERENIRKRREASQRRLEGN